MNGGGDGGTALGGGAGGNGVINIGNGADGQSG